MTPYFERLRTLLFHTRTALASAHPGLSVQRWILGLMVMGGVLGQAFADPVGPSPGTLSTDSLPTPVASAPLTHPQGTPSATPSATPATGSLATSSTTPGNPANHVVQPSADDEVPVDLWDRIRDGFALQAPDNDPRVARHEAWFAARPDYVERTMERSRMYLYFIVEEVQKRGMPMEIALLPIVESAFNPHALSRSQASGMWQFIPSTGRLFGLQQNWWYDGRKDVVAATTSALDYLQRLHEEFGTWELALAGYNCGEGKIRREMAYNKARNRPTDYLSLNLPDETRNYVPKLLAAKAIVLHPDQFGLILPPIPDEPYFAAVTTHQRLDTQVAAQLAEMNQEDFLMLNPGFNRPIISLDFNQEKTILVPVDVAERFVQKLEDPAVKLTTWKAHRLQRGEALEQVALQYGLTGAELKRVNGIASNKKVAGGGVILVPDQLASNRSSTEPPLSELDGIPEAQIPAPAPVSAASKQGNRHGNPHNSGHDNRHGPGGSKHAHPGASQHTRPSNKTPARTAPTHTHSKHHQTHKPSHP